MAVTRSTAAERTVRTSTVRLAVPAPRNIELAFLALASLFFATGLALAWRAKAEQYSNASPAPLNLNTIARREQLAPALKHLPAPQQQAALRRIYDFIQDNRGNLPNVGAIGRLRASPDKSTSPPLLTSAELAEFKRLVSVRTPQQFEWRLLLWGLAFTACFYAVHLAWVLYGFTGIQSVLPAIHLLTGIGFILMVSLRDPLRDTLSFAAFAQTTILGCILLGALSFLDFDRMFSRLSYVPLLASFALSIALILFGSGPGSSDAKVNLFGFQPVELIKILLVLFLAGYFARNWEFLRTLKDKREQLAKVSRWVDVPKLEYLMPVLIGIVLALLFFFFQKDLGPALILSGVFLLLYVVARERRLLAASAFALIVTGFAAGYFLRTPRTVRDRVDMWLSPWDNTVRGGEQVVHALWGMAAGGLTGAGLGLGDPELMPAAHTDLILAVLGEEWGFLGFASVFIVYTVLIGAGLTIAWRSRTDWGFFAALGFTLLLALEILLISGGVLDLLPLSGVVTPFLSYGGTAMLANFVVCAILVSLSRNLGDGAGTRPFHGVTRAITVLIGFCALAVVAKAGYIQVLRADETLGAGALSVQGDGFRRYHYNPRIMAIARTIPRGSIYDRNGLPLASSDWKTVESHRADYQRLGILLPQSEPDEIRHYPLGASAVHLLGDLRTRANWGARNSSLEERDSVVRLQGYDDRAQVVEVPHPRTGQPTYSVRYDYRELVPLLRHRYQPNHPDVRKVRDRNRDLRMSLDARLQWRTAALLRDHLKRLNKQRGAVVVMDAASGDLLASVSYPWPSAMPPVLSAPESDEMMLDRARYGLYPPGSTFKIVTAIAALRADPSLAQQRYECRRLPDGRVGNFIKGSNRPIRDDIADQNPHGDIAMDQAITVSCNAWFAQLAFYRVGPQNLLNTASLFGINVARPNTPAQLKDALAQAGYGQGQVVASPLQMARVAAAVAAGGHAPQGRWIIDESNQRTQPPQPVLPPALAASLAESMRHVVTSGTGRQAASAGVPISGKTGTAELENKPSHAWFIGFAPAGGRRIAFAVLIENGQYGGSAAAPLAAQVVAAANALTSTGAAQ